MTLASHYQITLALDGSGNFTYGQMWYTGTCSPANYGIYLESFGTYIVGGLVSGSTTLQSLTFTATSSDMMAFTTSIQTSVNNDCGGTSPYHAGVNSGNNGVHESTYMINCMSVNFPNSGRTSIDNIASLSGGVLSLGAPEEGIPGVFSGGSIPAAATVDFN